MAFRKPLVVSLCGTFLKPEMLSVYRQIAGLRRHRTVVFTERRLNADQFPFEPVVVMQRPPPAVRTKRRKQRQRGNFIRRFWYKHLLKQWPPPVKPMPIVAMATPAAIYDDSYNLFDLLKERQPQLAHVYYGHKAVKYLPMLRRWGGPLVVSFHGVDVTESVYRESDPSKLAEVFDHARLILGRSQSLLERLAALGCPPEKLRLNRTPVPLEGIRPATRTPPADGGSWRLLQACRLISKKGLHSTLMAMRLVVDAWPGAVLTLAGDGPLVGEIRALTTELGLDGNVAFAGWCAQDQLFSLYRDAHLFLHPSEMTERGDREGIPNSLLEGMAAGLPAVATWHGGIPEAVSDGRNGLLVPEKSPVELAAAVLRLMGDPALLATMSREAAASTEANFGAARQIAALEDCYEEAIAPRP